MGDSNPPVDLVRRRIVLQPDGAGDIVVSRDIPYHQTGGETLGFDLYRSSRRSSAAPAPAVVLINGYPDAGMKARLGCTPREMGSCVSWAELLACSGLAAVAYATSQPAENTRVLLRHLVEVAASLDIDSDRIGIWACSGNVPNALSLLLDDARPRVRCAALCYGYTMDPPGNPVVTGAARQFGFANPAVGASYDSLASDIPILIARAGLDSLPGLNDALDSFTAAALRRNLPLTLVNSPGLSHAFDILEDSDESRRVIRQILDFLRTCLSETR